jgi:1-acyl-sn-glycerol-3-phosphate acyltransferase
VSLKDYAIIGRALSEGWVITFPQGTTKPFAEIRRGIFHVITRFRPTVVPVVLDGFSSSFKRNGIRPVGRKGRLSIRIKPPLEIDQGETPEAVLQRISDGIEQTRSPG